MHTYEGGSVCWKSLQFNVRVITNRRIQKIGLPVPSLVQDLSRVHERHPGLLFSARNQASQNMYQWVQFEFWILTSIPEKD